MLGEMGPKVNQSFLQTIYCIVEGNCYDILNVYIQLQKNYYKSDKSDTNQMRVKFIITLPVYCLNSMQYSEPQINRWSEQVHIPHRLASKTEIVHLIVTFSSVLSFILQYIRTSLRLHRYILL